MNACSKKHLIRIDVADAGDLGLVHQELFNGARGFVVKDVSQRFFRECVVERLGSQEAYLAPLLKTLGWVETNLGKSAHITERELSAIGERHHETDESVARIIPHCPRLHRYPIGLKLFGVLCFMFCAFFCSDPGTEQKMPRHLHVHVQCLLGVEVDEDVLAAPSRAQYGGASKSLHEVSGRRLTNKRWPVGPGRRYCLAEHSCIQAVDRGLYFGKFRHVFVLCRKPGAKNFFNALENGLCIQGAYVHEAGGKGSCGTHVLFDHRQQDLCGVLAVLKAFSSLETGFCAHVEEHGSSKEFANFWMPECHESLKKDYGFR